MCGSVGGPVARFVVDCGAVLHVESERIEVRAEHELLAPTLLRSQTLSSLHEAVHAGEIPADVALERLARIWAMPIRLLGDAVLRRRAWKIAEQLGWADTYDAEYVALTQLQADAFVTLNAELTRRVDGSSLRRRSRRCKRHEARRAVDHSRWRLSQTMSPPATPRPAAALAGLPRITDSQPRGSTINPHSPSLRSA